MHILCSGHRLLSILMNFLTDSKIVLANRKKRIHYSKRAVFYRCCGLEYFLYCIAKNFDDFSV
jgi:hypothetical protein